MTATRNPRADSCRRCLVNVTLDLTPELGRRLKQAARQHGVSANAYTVQLLDRHLPGDRQAGDLVSLLQSWMDEENGGEQRDTGEYLVRALDDDRLSDRRFFPPEQKGLNDDRDASGGGILG